MAEDLIQADIGLFPRNVGPGTGVFTWIILLSLVLADLFLLDILTTQLILHMGGMELNPVMTGIVTTPALHILLKIGIVLCIIPVALNAEARIKGSGMALYAALIVMYTIVVLNNTSVLIPHILGYLAG
ncbi:hypothetical protein Mboo_2358 [Methanoregula boonei 6A8]|jgi:hypothetical protein|uniref:DUF5658 domain-containing protein n=1 Tax=Methanoregula boonei (strain DSM 21154 / JCM 14090 / 6A8) TaxID=456442 RepID=A7IAW1_METB6|nr:DUF5658 family protein [Methanoregula boonei]ABS56872.1 hypothetical protein Mboo_2358 [Methanoregula boonei 6A8]